jgi:hypothetical protein
MILLEMLREFRILILMVTRLRFYLNLVIKELSVCPRYRCPQSGYFRAYMPFPLYLLIRFCCVQARNFFYNVFSLVRSIDIGISKQYCYKFCFFTHISGRCPFIIVLTFLVHPTIFLFTVFITLTIYLIQNISVKIVFASDGRNN